MDSRAGNSPDILFVYCDLTTPEDIEYCGYHLGIGYLRAFLEKEGISSGQLILGRPMSLEDLANEIVEHRSPILGFSCYDSNFFLVSRLASAVKEKRPETRVVIGGPTATFSDRLIFRRCRAADICVRGEGERTLAELIPLILSGAPHDHIPGITFRRGEEIIVNPMAGFGGDLDCYPSPYLSGVIPPEEGLKTGLLTSRGCVYPCIYCNFAAMSRHRLRMHAVDRVIDELKAIDSAVASANRLLHIHDDAFTHYPNRMKEICRKIIQHRLNRIGYTCNGRIDHLDEEALTLLRDANIRLHFGIESANPRVLEKIKKVGAMPGPDSREPEKAFLERVEEKVRLALKLGINNLSSSIILGLPGEGPKEARESLDFVRRLKIKEYAHNYLRLYPGTALFDSCPADGLAVSEGPYGLPYDITYAYDVFEPKPLSTAAQIRIAVHDKKKLARVFDGLCGGPGAAYPSWIYCLGSNGEQELLKRNAALTTMALLAGGRRSKENMRDWHVRAAERGLAIKRPWFACQQGDMSRSGTMRIDHIYLRGREAVWEAMPFSTLFGEAGGAGEARGDLLLTIETEKDLRTFRSLLAAKYFHLPASLAKSGLVVVTDACRWADAPCTGAGLHRLLFLNGRARACFHGPDLARFGSSLKDWRTGMIDAARSWSDRNDCKSCPARERCSRCPFTGEIERQHFCEIKRNYPNADLLIRFLGDFHVLYEELGGSEMRFPFFYGADKKSCFVSLKKGAFFQYRADERRVTGLGGRMSAIIEHWLECREEGAFLSRVGADLGGLDPDGTRAVVRELIDTRKLPDVLLEEARSQASGNFTF